MIEKYYIAKNGLEYPVKLDAEKYGGGCVGERPATPKAVKYYEGEEDKVEKDTPVLTDEELTALTMDELKEMAKKYGMKGLHFYRSKDKLVAKIQEYLQG